LNPVKIPIRGYEKILHIVTHPHEGFLRPLLGSFFLEKIYDSRIKPEYAPGETKGK